MSNKIQISENQLSDADFPQLDVGSGLSPVHAGLNKAGLPAIKSSITSIRFDIPLKERRFRPEDSSNGKERTEVAKVKKATKTEIEYSQQRDGSLTVLITGKAPLCTAAKKMVLERLLSAGFTTVTHYRATFECPVEYQPFIRGGNDSNLNSLKTRHGITAIVVPPPKAGKTEIVVRGQQKGVEAAVAELKAMVQLKSSNCFKTTIPVEKKKHRFVIGQQGKRIQEVLEKHGVIVEVPAQDSNSEEVVLRGEAHAIGNAIAAVYGFVNSGLAAFNNSPERPNGLVIADFIPEKPCASAEDDDLTDLVICEDADDLPLSDILNCEKAPKDQVTAVVNKLLEGKKEFKAKTGADYDAKKKPAGGASPAATQARAPTASVSSGALAAWEATTAQGNVVRDLKSKKASKDEIMAAVGKLKELKESFKKVAGTDYDANKKPVGGSSAAAPVAAAASAASPHMDLWKQTVEQGDKVRKLKAGKASKDNVTAAVNELKVPSGPPDLPGSCSDSEQCSIQVIVSEDEAEDEDEDEHFQGASGDIGALRQEASPVEEESEPMLEQSATVGARRRGKKRLRSSGDTSRDSQPSTSDDIVELARRSTRLNSENFKKGVQNLRNYRPSSTNRSFANRQLANLVFSPAEKPLGILVFNITMYDRTELENRVYNTARLIRNDKT